jgi:hypothetical protein
MGDVGASSSRILLLVVFYYPLLDALRCAMAVPSRSIEKNAEVPCLFELLVAMQAIANCLAVMLKAPGCGRDASGNTSVASHL